MAWSRLLRATQQTSVSSPLVIVVEWRWTDRSAVTARQKIKVAQTRFTGGPAFDEKGKIYVTNPSPKMFVGDPIAHPEIDHNWDNLTWGTSESQLTCLAMVI